MRWRMVREMLTRPYDDSRLAACVFGLHVLEAHPSILASVPTAFLTALVSIQPEVKDFIRTDGVMVDMLPMLAEYIQTPTGKAHLARVIEQHKVKQEKEGDNHE